MYRVLLSSENRPLFEELHVKMEGTAFMILPEKEPAALFAAARQMKVDLVLLDESIFPNPCRLCESLCHRFGVSVLVISGREEEAGRLLFFAAGADDLVAPTCGAGEIFARARAILYRKKGRQHDVAPITAMGVQIDSLCRKVTVNGREIPLSNSEYQLLLHLAENQNHCLSRRQLLMAIHGGDEVLVDERSIDTYIKLLRRKLKPYACLIQTVRGFGYCFSQNQAAPARARRSIAEALSVSP